MSRAPLVSCDLCGAYRRLGRQLKVLERATPYRKPGFSKVVVLLRGQRVCISHVPDARAIPAGGGQQRDKR